MEPIRHYHDLSDAEKHQLIAFFEAHKGPWLPKTPEEVHRYLTLEDLDHGRRFFSYWAEGRPLACLGLILAALQRKGEVYLIGAALADTPASAEAFKALLGHCNRLAREAGAGPLTSRLGLGPRLAFAEPLAAQAGYTLHETMLHLALLDRPRLMAKAAPALTPAPLSESTLEAYLQLHNDAFAEVPNGGTTTKEALREWLAEDHPDEWRGLLSHGPRPVAFYELTLTGSTGMIEAIGVAPAEQGQGYGRAALQAAVTLLEAKGAKEIELLVMDSNRPAYELYLKAGFGEKGVYNRWFRREL